MCSSLGHVRLMATPWTVAHQAPPSMGFSGQEYWSGLPIPKKNSREKRREEAYIKDTCQPITMYGPYLNLNLKKNGTELL